MGKGSGFPDRLRDLLDPIGRKLGMDGAIEAGRVFARWRSIVGADVAAHVEPTSLRDGVLRVRTDSPAWATEIGYLAGEIAAQVNAAVGRTVVTELRVTSAPRVGDPAKRASEVASATPSSGRTREARSDAETDPMEALERARSAWARRKQKMASDQDF